MKLDGGHWYRIRFVGAQNASQLEQVRMLKVIGDEMAGRARQAAAKRAAGRVVTVRPARIYAHLDDGATVWHLDDGALALYRVVGGSREPDAHVDALPVAAGIRRILSGRYYT